MFRSFFIWLSKLDWAQKMIMRWGLAWRAASRFIAGETPEDAIRVIRELNTRGIQTSLDHLGENTVRPEDAVQATSDILELLDKIKLSGVQSNISVKLTQIGLALGDELCKENLNRILKKAQTLGNFIRLDMEESQFTDNTLYLYRYFRSIGFNNVGIVIQAYFYRSRQDILSLAEIKTRVRLCKGAYQEPSKLAYPKKKDVDANYEQLANILLDEALSIGINDRIVDPIFPPIPAIATHDTNRIRQVKDYALKIGLAPQLFEFQMLYGIRRDLQEELVKQGYRVRVYVPYGTRWYPYFMRRLAERPANVWFFLSNYFRK